MKPLIKITKTRIKKFKVDMTSVTLKVKLQNRVDEEQADILDSCLRSAIVKWGKQLREQS